MIRPWLYFVNPFLMLGLKSFRKAVKISTYTNSALANKTDAFYMGQYALYNPLHLALIIAYDTWKSQGGTQKGASVSLHILLQQLGNAKINAWDAMVSVVFPKGSAEHTAIFPQGHKPFQQGTIDERINRVNALSISLTPYGALAAVKADVDGFYGVINASRTVQEGEKSDTHVDSDAVATAVTNAMQGLYTFLVNGLAQFPTDPSVLEAMFDLQTIRHHIQMFFTGHVQPLAVRTVVKRTFHQDIDIEIENTSSWAITVYASDVKGAMPGATSVSVPAFHTVLVNLTDLGPLTNHYLQVYNPNAFQEAGYHINLDPDAMEQAA